MEAICSYILKTAMLILCINGIRHYEKKIHLHTYKNVQQVFANACIILGNAEDKNNLQRKKTVPNEYMC